MRSLYLHNVKPLADERKAFFFSPSFVLPDNAALTSSSGCLRRIHKTKRQENIPKLPNLGHFFILKDDLFIFFFFLHTLTRAGTRAAAAALITPRLPGGEPMMERNVLKPEEESSRRRAVCARHPGVGGRSRRPSVSELVKAEPKNPYERRGRVVRGRSMCKQASLAEADLRKREKKKKSEQQHSSGSETSFYHSAPSGLRNI